LVFGSTGEYRPCKIKGKIVQKKMLKDNFVRIFYKDRILFIIWTYNYTKFQILSQAQTQEYQNLPQVSTFLYMSLIK
jgi:translation initiation factor IF-1